MAKLLSFMKSAVIFSLVFFAQMVTAAEFPPAPNPSRRECFRQIFPARVEAAARPASLR